MYLPKRKKRLREKLCCPVCKGAGKVKVRIKGPPKTESFEEIPCPRCKGSGFIYV